MIEIMPYVKFDGIPTFRDSDIKSLYETMEKDGTASIVFFDDGIKSSHDFLEFMNTPGIMLFVARKDNVPIGCGWLSHFENRTARAHFCVFKDGWGEGSVIIGRKMVEGAMEAFSDIDMLIGMLPTINTKAIDFAIRCGAQLVGEFPFGTIDGFGNSYPTSILYYVR